CTCLLLLSSLLPRPSNPVALPSFPTRRSSDLTSLMSLHMLVQIPLLTLAGVFIERAVRARHGTSAGDVAKAECVGWSYNEYGMRSEEHTSELQSRENLVCRLLLEKKKTRDKDT